MDSAFAIVYVLTIKPLGLQYLYSRQTKILLLFSASFVHLEKNQESLLYKILTKKKVEYEMDHKNVKIL